MNSTLSPEDGQSCVEFNDCVRNYGRSNRYTTINRKGVNGRRYRIYSLFPGLNVTQESNESLPQRILRAREMTHPRLARFAREAPENCQEVYLFRGEKFFGIRFALGSFQADWKINEPQICVYNGTHEIDRIDLIPTPSRRAA